MEKVKEKILRWQLLAEQYLKDNSNVYIKKLNGDIHFCKIILNDEIKTTVDNYGPKQRANTKEEIEWLQIDEFEKVREES